MFSSLLFTTRFTSGTPQILKARLLSHNILATKGWTIKFRPWTLVHQEIFDTKKQAMTREKELKSSQGEENGFEKIFLNQ
jgi:putative endonuclease